MARVLQHYHGHIRSDQLHLLPQCNAQRLLAADHQNRHRQLRLRQLREILRCLLERNEVSPTSFHTAWARVSRGIRFAIGFRNRTRPVSGEVIPEILKVNALASLNQCFGCRPIETEMPDTRIVVYDLPPRDTWQEGV